MQSKIDELIDELWFNCVSRPVADNIDQAKEWEEDRDLYLSLIIKTVGPLPEKLQPLVNEAIMEWQKGEEYFFKLFRKDRETFLQIFNQVRESIYGDTDEWRRNVKDLGPNCNKILLNMDIVNVFSWILPNADTINAPQYRQIGELMSSILYMSILWKKLIKYQGEIKTNADLLNMIDIKNIDARWKAANGLL